MDPAIPNGRSEGQAVFVADDFRDFGVSGGKLSGAPWKIGAAAGGLREGSQNTVRGFELLLSERKLFGVSRFLPSALRDRSAQAATQGDGENADAAGLQLIEEGFCGVRRSGIDAGREQDDGFFAGDRAEPRERLRDACGKIQRTEAEIELQVLERVSRRPLIDREVLKKLGGSGIARDGNLIVARKTVEEAMRRGEMAGFEQIDGRAGLDKNENMGRLEIRGKVGERLLGAIVEDLEIGAAQAADEPAARIGDGNADFDTIYLDTNRRVLGRC